MVAIPVSSPILSKAWRRKVGLKIRDRHCKDMEVGEKKHRESPDGTELHTAVTEGTMLINAAVLVMLCIVCEHSKSLNILVAKGEKK
jgi:hypothetical protein